MFVALSSFPKADAKVLHFSFPTKFFSNYFSKKIHFFRNHPNYQANIFYLFFELFVGVLLVSSVFRFLLLKFKSDSEAKIGISATNYFKFSDF